MNYCFCFNLGPTVKSEHGCEDWKNPEEFPQANLDDKQKDASDKQNNQREKMKQKPMNEEPPEMRNMQ